MLRQFFSLRRLFLILGICWGVWMVSLPAQAATSYVRQYLRVTEPISLNLDGQGQTRQFSVEDFSAGKQLFEQHCLNCHVGGATLPNPAVSLSLKDLNGAIPPRDPIHRIVACLRQPMTYDGSEESFWCRQVPESWMSRQEVETIAAFVLRAAQVAPGWGTNDF